MLRPARTQVLCPRVPTIEAIRQRGREVFGHRPCLWQAELVRAVLQGGKDIIAISGTGSGKTLTFWLPLLFCPDGIQLVITPLNILGAQNRNQLASKNISAISVDAQSFSPKVMQDIAVRKYRVVIVNPELALAEDGPFQKLWKDREFVSHMISVVWDEAHCISYWSPFRKEYAEAGRLRNLLVEDVPHLVTSATFPEKVKTDVTQILKMTREKTTYILRSNDRPNVYLGVRRIQHSLKSFKDLECLVPKDWKPGDEVPKFLIFFDSIQESVDAIKALAEMMPPELRDRLIWFNSDMSKNFREVMTMKFKDSDEICILGCTDSFGLGIDVPHVTFVGQWRVTPEMDNFINAATRDFGCYRVAKGSSLAPVTSPVTRR
ncbi:P-loop containing nucleoside triphosphate hydrolase protein [Irpex lacteus]|nr:P-loop containing nucleoside triphosphate hydrolase protein [Irpex lacteus]